MLDAFLRWFGFGLCHQLPERSFVAGGLQAPVCARDTGIYVGFAVALVVIALIHRGERPTGFPKAHVWATMGVLLAFMAWDGITSYGGLRPTTNELRLLSGLGVGFSAAAVMAPILNDELWRRPGAGSVLDPVWRFLVWLVAIPVTFAAVDLIGPRLGIAFPLLIALCIVATLAAINLVVVAMLPPFDRRALRLLDLVPAAGVAIAFAFVEVALAAQLKAFLIRITATIL